MSSVQQKFKSLIGIEGEPRLEPVESREIHELLAARASELTVAGDVVANLSEPHITPQELASVGVDNDHIEAVQAAATAALRGMSE